MDDNYQTPLIVDAIRRAAQNTTLPSDAVFHSDYADLRIMPLATATVDRLLHHAHLCQTSGESVRLSQALTGKGAKALT